DLRSTGRFRVVDRGRVVDAARRDRKSTRLNSSHLGISYAVFCLKKKKTVEMGLVHEAKQPLLIAAAGQFQEAVSLYSVGRWQGLFFWGFQTEDVKAVRTIASTCS